VRHHLRLEVFPPARLPCCKCTAERVYSSRVLAVHTLNTLIRAVGHGESRCEDFCLNNHTDDQSVPAAHRRSSTQLCLAATLRRRKSLVLSLASGTQTQAREMGAGASQQVVECVAKLSMQGGLYVAVSVWKHGRVTWIKATVCTTCVMLTALSHTVQHTEYDANWSIGIAGTGTGIRRTETQFLFGLGFPQTERTATSPFSYPGAYNLLACQPVLGKIAHLWLSAEMIVCFIASVGNAVIFAESLCFGASAQPLG